jgi:hypothetical protein
MFQDYCCVVIDTRVFCFIRLLASFDCAALPQILLGSHYEVPARVVLTTAE